MLKIDFDKIISLQKSKEPGYFYSLCPEEFYNSGYKYGQTIILKGDKIKYSSIEEFWLACMSWYSDEGQDTFFRNKYFDDLSGVYYKNMLLNKDYVKVLKEKLAVETKTSKDFYLEKILRFIPQIIPNNLVVMDSTWDEEKVLFMDKDNYYLYYFWTGE